MKRTVKNAGLLQQYTGGKPVSVSPNAERGGWEALRIAVNETGSVIETISAAGLRGRSGAGFPVDAKWELVHGANTDRKYVVCNADEGEPGTVKDRVLLSEAPQLVIEGMAICGIAVGAKQGYIYLRAEYANLCKALEQTIEDAKKNGFLGEGILGGPHGFHIEIRMGQGSYVCGEETALLESLEGRRGEPRMKPPFPGEAGLWGMPTVINNVETFANIPLLLIMGADKFRKTGTASCPGTKLFTLSGNIERPGVYEYPTGVTLRELYEVAGGGCPEGKKLKGIQTGGASGTIVRAEKLDMRMDIESCAAEGALLGTGALMFFDEDKDVVDLCRNLTSFFARESCGLCAPCRIGLEKLEELLGRLTEGGGAQEEIEKIETLCRHISVSARCGLGQTAPTPVLSALKNFREEFVAVAGEEART